MAFTNGGTVSFYEDPIFMTPICCYFCISFLFSDVEVNIWFMFAVGGSFRKI